MKKLREVVLIQQESIKNTWGDKDWRKASKIYSHYNKRLSKDDELGDDEGFNAYNKGIKGIISRAVIKATAPLSNRYRYFQTKVYRDTARKQQHTVNRVKVHFLNNPPDVVDRVDYHHQNIRRIQKKLRAKRINAKK
jgi:hypothetical protein